MNYPIQGLTVIAPIVFLVLMIGIPALGVFAGWKRAAYWGGGTFFFFLVGMIVWKAGGKGITSGLVSLINGLLPSGAKATSTLVASLAAPVFFLIVMFLAEVILVINYYTWFKRVSGIKEDIAAKKAYKAAKKANKKAATVSSSQGKPKGWTQMQFTTKGKIINMACGGAGMALLLAPSSVTFTQAIMYTTTSATTRANSAFCAGLYNSLQNTASAFSWMSYYGDADTGKDFDSLFATLTLTSKKIKYIDPKTGQETEKTVIEAIGNSSANGIAQIIEQATQTSSQTEQQQLTAVTGAVDKFADAWNVIVQSSQNEVSALFKSENVTQVLKSTISTIIEEKQQLKSDDIKAAYGDDSLLKKMLGQVSEQYKSGAEVIEIEITDPETGQVTATGTMKRLSAISVSQESFNNIKESFKGAVDTSQLDDEATKLFDEALGDILSMMFVY